MVELETFYFAFRRVTLILLVQNKVSKQKDTPCHGHCLPCAALKVGRCGTRPNKAHKPWLVAELLRP